MLPYSLQGLATRWLASLPGRALLPLDYATLPGRTLRIPPDMVNTVNKKQVSIASFFIGVPMLATRFINIFQFMTRGGVIV